MLRRSFHRVRRIATRYDKLASRFSSFIAVVASFIVLAEIVGDVVLISPAKSRGLISDMAEMSFYRAFQEACGCCR